MNRIYKSLSALCVVGAVVMAGCSEEENGGFTEGTVGVKAVVNRLQTRANTEEAGDVWDLNDQINVTCDAGHSFATYSRTESGWTSLSPLSWTAQSMTFAAYYPAPNTAADLTSFQLADVQNTVELLKAQDYMVAVAAQQSQADDNNQITLNFARQTAKVTVKIAPFADGILPTVSNVKICSYYSSVTDGTNGGNLLEITPYDAGGENGYTALVLPSATEQSAETFIKLDFNGSTLTLTGIPAMQPGYAYIYTLTLNVDRVMFATVTIKEWNTGTIPGGIAIKNPENDIQSWEH